MNTFTEQRAAELARKALDGWHLWAANPTTGPLPGDVIVDLLVLAILVADQPEPVSEVAAA